MSPLTVYILCRNHAYFKRHWKRFHRNEWEKHLFSFLMSIIPLTWRSSAVRTNVWKCFLAIFSVSKKSLCGSEICVLQRGQWFLEVWTRQPTGNAVSFFFFFPHWNYNSLRNISEICEKIYWKICHSSDVKILMNCNIVQNRKHLFFGGMKDCWMKTWMKFFSELNS